MKPQVKKLKELKKMVKWKLQIKHGLWVSRVEALTKEKKEKENVLIDLELINLKNVSLLNYEKFRRITKVEIEKLVEANKEH